MCLLLNTNSSPCLHRADINAYSKGHQTSGKWKRLIKLLKCPNRDAPYLLGYELTYQHFPKKKDRSKMRKVINLRKIAREEYQLRRAAHDASSQYVVTDPNIPVPSGPGDKPPKATRRKGETPLAGFG